MAAQAAFKEDAEADAAEEAADVEEAEAKVLPIPPTPHVISILFTLGFLYVYAARNLHVLNVVDSMFLCL